MTRKGIRITSEIDPKDRGVIESLFDELELWTASTTRSNGRASMAVRSVSS